MITSEPTEWAIVDKSGESAFVCNIVNIHISTI